MDTMIKGNIEKIRSQIEDAAQKSGRQIADVRLMAVTKTVDDLRILEAIKEGVDIIGENYVQEARRKIEIMGRPLEWHLIGHLQTNKAKYAVRLFDLIHSVDRLDVAHELNKRAQAVGRVSRILIEINISGEATKSGIPQAQATPLIRDIALLQNLSIQGLMTMPPWFDNAEKARPYFIALRELKERIIQEAIERVSMTELSMGMSDDYPVAVEEGATIVRIGRAIFGERPA